MPEENPPTLDYRGPNPQLEQQDLARRENTRAVVGSILTFFTTLIAGFYLIVPGPRGHTKAMRVSLIAVLSIYAILLIIGLYLLRRHRSAHFARGLLWGFIFGIGLIALCYGICAFAR